MAFIQSFMQEQSSEHHVAAVQCKRAQDKYPQKRDCALMTGICEPKNWWT